MENLNLSFGELHSKNPGAKTLEKMEKELDRLAPEFKGFEKVGYTIVGKVTRGKNRYLVQDSEGDYFFTVVTDENASPLPSGRTEELGEINLDIVKMGEIEYDPNMFVPLKSNSPLDFVFSKKGGIMPATNYIILGDPGIGKSTLSINLAAEMQANNPDKKILFISGEMTRVDMAEYLERFPIWKKLSTVFVSEFTEGRYKETFEQLFRQGWDFIVGDSFAEIVDAVREDFNMFQKGKMSSTGAEKWLIDLMVDNNLGNNEDSKYTSHLIIQQVTKGGKFVGSNKLKHNTTGMIELRYTGSGEKKIEVSKNRRGNEYDGLIFDFPETGGIEFDVARLEREKELNAKINSERDQLLADERRLDELFGTGNNSVTDDAEVEEITVEEV